MGLKQTILAFILNHTILFKHFKCVYLFGSSINEDSTPHDIDLLLVYSIYYNGITDDMESISIALENELHMPIDLTVLSTVELNNTDFLNKIKSYQKLK